MKLRNALMALSLSIALTLGTFSLNAHTSGVIEVIIMDNVSKQLTVNVQCEDVAVLQLIDHEGVIVYNNDVNAGTLQLNVNGLSGVYTFLLIDSNGHRDIAIVNL